MASGIDLCDDPLMSFDTDLGMLYYDTVDIDVETLNKAYYDSFNITITATASDLVTTLECSYVYTTTPPCT